eukprot:5983817-Ditylum_brightwellii.AAC.1
MPEEVIKKIHRLARRNPAGISFYDRNGNVTILPDDPADDPDNDPEYDPAEDADSDDDDDGNGTNEDEENPGEVPPQPPEADDVPTAG